MKDLIQAKTAIHDIDEWAEYEAQLDKAIESCTGEDQAANGCQRWTRRSEERRIEDLGPCALLHANCHGQRKLALACWFDESHPMPQVRDWWGRL
jgi:hypothetical protein